MKKKPAQVKRTQHHFTGTKIMPWSYCVTCGLILLNNKLTSIARNRDCHHTEDADWPAIVEKNTKFFTDQT